MSFTIGPAIIGRSTLLAGNQPLRGTWRRSAAAIALEVVSGSFADTSLEQLYQKLDERLARASLVRGSAPTFTDDTVTIDLVVVAHPPQGLTASAVAMTADQLVTGLPLVNLNGRVRQSGEENRGTARDEAAIVGQDAADAAGLGAWFSELGSTAKLVLAAGVVIALVAGAIYFLPRPKKST